MRHQERVQVEEKDQVGEKAVVQGKDWVEEKDQVGEKDRVEESLGMSNQLSFVLRGIQRNSNNKLVPHNK